MKFLFDFGPIILFFVVYKFFGLYAAIYAMIASTFAQMMYARITTGKFVTSQVLTFILLIVFGGISIALRDPAFVMWKVSVLYVIFAVALIASNWIGSKTLLERMMGKELDLPRSIWTRLTWCWGFGWGDEVIDVKTRSMMNLSMIGALGKMTEWELHCKGAINNGVSKEEVRAIIHVIAIYCGVPQALECFRVARKVFE